MKTGILCYVLLLFALPALAETYIWEDDQGTVNFTEDLGSVPAKYRKKARIVGEEEPPPPEGQEQAEKPAAPEKREEPGVAREGVKPSRQEKMKEVYGDKEASAWKAEYAALDADVKSAEKQLVEYRKRMKDTDTMSRTEYLSLTNSIKLMEDTVLKRREKLEVLKREAAEAGVPAELFE